MRGRNNGMPKRARSAIRNAGYLVRHYVRGGRSTIQRKRREAAIRALGLACRDAFNRTDDFEPLLITLVDSLLPRNDPPF